MRPLLYCSVWGLGFFRGFFGEGGEAAGGDTEAGISLNYLLSCLCLENYWD